MERLEDLAGQLLDGRYALRAVIGTGGSAVVFRAEDLLLHRAVAIKMLRSEAAPGTIGEGKTYAERLAKQAEARRINREAFVRESITASILSHPSIVTIFDVCPETDNPYIVMELVQGRSLATRMEEVGVLPLHELLLISRRILEALVEAHERGIVHRDLKAQNVLLTREGGVKVTDFGIAEIAGRRTLEIEGKVLGTADTMSPEQASGGRVDARSDLYSLGALMYQMATGHLPFEDDDPKTVAFLHQTEPPRYPTTLNPAIPRGLEQIILTALEKEADKRFASASAMLAAVRTLEKRPRHIFRRFSHKRVTLESRLARNAVAPLFVGAIAAALLFALVFAFTGGLRQENVSIVTLGAYIDRQYADVAAELDPHISIQLRYVLRTDLPEGYIVEQSPDAGTRWKFDREDDRETLWLQVVTHDPTQVTG